MRIGNPFLFLVRPFALIAVVPFNWAGVHTGLGDALTPLYVYVRFGARAAVAPTDYIVTTVKPSLVSLAPAFSSPF